MTKYIKTIAEQLDFGSVESQQVILSDSIAQMAHIGFLLDANTSKKLSIISILLDSYQNLAIFTDVQKNNLKNAYNYALSL